MRCTGTRIAVLQTLKQAKGAPIDAVQIYRRLIEAGHSILLPTVYVTLRELVEQRLVGREVGGRSRATFRLL